MKPRWLGHTLLEIGLAALFSDWPHEIAPMAIPRFSGDGACCDGHRRLFFLLNLKARYAGIEGVRGEAGCIPNERFALAKCYGAMARPSKGRMIKQKLKKHRWIQVALKRAQLTKPSPVILMPSASACNIRISSDRKS